MKWILWLSLTLVLGYVTLRVVLASIIASSGTWTLGPDFKTIVLNNGVADMVEALKTEPSDA